MREFKQFILFGGCGFIGQQLQAYLRLAFPDAQVYVGDLRIESESALQRRIDVRSPIEWEGDFGAQTLIFNLAAIHKTPGHPDLDYFETNIRGAENVCDFARRHGIEHIVFTSSIAPYGAAEELKSESTLPTPNTPYGISKLVSEKIHQVWQAQSSSRSLSIVRPGIVFGKGEGGNFTRLYKALNKGMFAYAGRKDTRKAAIYVKDLCRIMVLMARNEESHFQLYNCCAPAPATIEEIVETVKKVTGIRKHVPLIPAWMLNRAAGVLGALDAVGLGFHPDRVKKLMVSTRIDGHALDNAYPLEYTLESAIEDWWKDCGGNGLE